MNDRLVITGIFVVFSLLELASGCFLPPKTRRGYASAYGVESGQALCLAMKAK